MVYNSYTREAFCGHLHYLLPVPGGGLYPSRSQYNPDSGRACVFVRPFHMRPCLRVRVSAGERTGGRAGGRRAGGPSVNSAVLILSNLFPEIRDREQVVQMSAKRFAGITIVDHCKAI